MKTEQLTEQQMKNVNGGDGILAYDPTTGQPFNEETGGYGQGNDGRGNGGESMPPPPSPSDSNGTGYNSTY